MKNKILAVSLMICVGSSLMAQQMPLVSQMYFMRMLYNPALTAYNGSTNVYLFDREQWTAMPGHPTTRGGMGEISLWGDRSGVGASVYDDVTSVINTVNAQLYYRQKIKLAKDHHLSLGVSVGLMQTSIDYSNLISPTPDVTDPHILGAARGGIAFDMNAGIAYQWKKLTVGFAIEHATNSTVIIADQLKNTTYDIQRHYIANASYEFSFKKETWNLEPSVLFKKGSGTPIQFDFDAMANYKRFLYLGIGYRLNYGASIQAAVRISHCVTLGYAYEYPTIQHVSYGSTGGTHEVLVGINFDKWLKNPELNRQRKRLDSLEAQIKEMKHTDTVLGNRIDSLEAATKQVSTVVDTNKRNEDGKIHDLNDRVDSLQKQLNEYKDIIKKSPVTSFSGENVDPNKIYKMDKVYFQTNSSYLKDESYVQLKQLLDLMKANPDMTLKVMGHTDYVASETYNQWLSERRAKRVADYLTSNGIDKSRVSWVGFGKKLPVADNSTEEGRALNRRVEILILKK